MQEIQRTSGTPAAFALLITHLQYSPVRSIADLKVGQWQVPYALDSILVAWTASLERVSRA